MHFRSHLMVGLLIEICSNITAFPIDDDLHESNPDWDDVEQ